jgi:hypothetical protein
VNRVGVACDEYHFFRANLLKSDLRELSNYRDEPPVDFLGPSSLSSTRFPCLAAIWRRLFLISGCLTDLSIRCYCSDRVQDTLRTAS